MKRFLDIAVLVTRCVLVLAFLAPMFIYVRTFGADISSSHARWAEMGSAMSGIYGPILAILTVLLLTVQLRLQQQTNKHVFDQAHIQQADANVAFYLERLEKSLNSLDASGTRKGTVLESMFKYPTLEQLRTHSHSATVLNYEDSEVFAAWSAFQTVITGLGAVKEHSYELSLTSAKQRAIVVLSYGMCVTLDNYSWCLNEGRSNVPYLFSPLSLDRR